MGKSRAIRNAGARRRTYRRFEYPSTLSPTLKTRPLPAARLRA
jgi:hypothetical protein